MSWTTAAEPFGPAVVANVHLLRANVTNAQAIVVLTSSGHTVTMDTVSVAALKAKLSHYLREVREGKSFTVLSRDIPVATSGPWDPQAVDDLRTTPADPHAPGLLEKLLGPAGLCIDGAELIRRDREESDARLGDAGPRGSGTDRELRGEDER